MTTTQLLGMCLGATPPAVCMYAMIENFTPTNTFNPNNCPPTYPNILANPISQTQFPSFLALCCHSRTESCCKRF